MPARRHIDRASSESGTDRKRLNLPFRLVYRHLVVARFPEHYAGDVAPATKELGEWNVKNWIEAVVDCIKTVKAEDNSLRIQKEFL